MLNLKIKLSSYNAEMLEFNKKLIYLFLRKRNIEILFVNLPQKFKNFVLLRSPHVFKKSKEHFTLYNKSCILIVKLEKRNINYYLNFLLSKLSNVQIEINYKEE